MEPSHEIAGAVGPAVAVGILQDCDAIRALRPARRGIRNAVVDCPRVAIDGDSLELGGVRILHILNNPEPAPVVKLDGYRLAYQGLGCHQADFQAIGDGHMPGSFRGGVALGLDRPAE